MFWILIRCAKVLLTSNSTHLSTYNIGLSGEIRKIFMWLRGKSFHLYVFINYNLQSTPVISNSKGLSEILRDICTLTYLICRIEEKLIQLTTFNKYMCNWTLEVRDILKIL